MIRLVIFGVAAFVLGLGGSTGVLVMTAPARPPGSDSLAVAHADSAHVVPAPGTALPGGAAADTASQPNIVPPNSAVAAASVPRGPAVTTVEPPTPAETPGAVPNVTADPVAALRPGPAVPDTERFKQVGSILLNMKPVEAARILGYLTDEQVEGLLRSMSPRNAAGLLAQLQAERAAVLSKRLLVSRPKEVSP